MTQSSFIPSEPYKTKKVMLNITTDLPAEYVGPKPDRDLINSIRQYGVIEPIVVRPMRGKYALIDGRRRVAALRELIKTDTEGRGLVGWQHVAAVVVDTDKPVHAAALTVMLHATRDDNVAAEIKAIEEMQDRGASESDIRDATGLSIATIRQRMRMLNFMIPDIRELLSTAKIKPSIAEEASKLKPSDQKKLIKIFEENGKITAKDVRAIRSVKAAEALAAMPDNIFTTEETPTPNLLVDALKAIRARCVSERDLYDRGQSYESSVATLSQEIIEAVDAALKQD